MSAVKHPGKILFIVGGFQIGGAERHLSLVLPRLNTPSREVAVLRLGADGPMSAALTAGGIPIRSAEPRAALPIAKLGALFSIFGQIRETARAIEEIEPDIVHCFLPEPCWIGWLAHRRARSRAPLLMSKRSLWIRPGSFPGEKRLERAALRSATQVIGNSNGVLADLAGIGVKPERTALIHNGIDPGDFDAPRAWTPPWPAGRIVVAMNANLIPYKGHRDALDAAAAIDCAERPVQFAFMGTGDPVYRSSLQNAAAVRGLSDNVTFLGHVRDVASVLAYCDIGMLASHHEGFSNALLEYMAAGLPVVATGVGGNPDAVQDGETGFLAPAKAPRALGLALDRLLRDPVLRRKLGQAGRRRVEAEFSLGSCVRKYERLYSAALDKAGAGAVRGERTG